MLCEQISVQDAGAGLNDETTSEVLYKMSNNYTKEEGDICFFSIVDPRHLLKTIRNGFANNYCALEVLNGCIRLL